MKRMIVLSLVSFNLMTAIAYAQPAQPVASMQPMQDTQQTTQQAKTPLPTSHQNRSQVITPMAPTLPQQGTNHNQLSNATHNETNNKTNNKIINQNALIPLQVSTVALAKTLKNDTPVRVQGQVIRALGKDKYEFRDATGTLIAAIDNQKWHGTPITQQAQVILIGEIDRESDHTIELDVDEVRIIIATP